MELNDEAVLADTRRWIEKAVIGLNLCPFARSVYVKNQVRIVVGRARHLDAFLDELDRELDLLVNTLVSEMESLHENGVRLNTIGDTDSLPPICRATLMQAIEQTAKNDRVVLTLALSYSARWELLRAVRTIAQDVKDGRLEMHDVNDALVDSRLSTAGMPDPELLIRTSGEQRISNFLLWQIAYAELWFTTVLWPDFRKEHLFQAVLDFQNRERRFGLTSDQVIP